MSARYLPCTDCYEGMMRFVNAGASCGTRNIRGRNSWQKDPISSGAAGTLWVITKLRGPGKYTYYYLYVIIDVFSRYVVGWCVAYRESAELAEKLILDACLAQGIERGHLTIHADRGSGHPLGDDE